MIGLMTRAFGADDVARLRRKSKKRRLLMIADIPTSREAKYKAKAAIDAFFMRFGDVLQAGIVYAGTALGFVLSSFAALNLAFTVVWFFIAAALAREYKNRSAQAARKEVSHESEELHRAVSGD